MAIGCIWLFERRQDAEAYIAEFKASCCDTKYFECANPDTLKVEVVDRDLFKEI